jgi:hypothetical protein
MTKIEEDKRELSKVRREMENGAGGVVGFRLGVENGDGNWNE